MSESALDMLRKEAKGKNLRKNSGCKEKGDRKNITNKVHRSHLHRALSFMSTNRKGN
jgi:hypothetical protein